MSVDDILRPRDHGAKKPDLPGDLRALGCRDLEAEDEATLSVFGIGTDFTAQPKTDGRQRSIGERVALRLGPSAQ